MNGIIWEGCFEQLWPKLAMNKFMEEFIKINLTLATLVQG